MTSLAKRHIERVRAAKTAALSQPGESLVGASHYELMLAKLASDKRRLKAIQSVARKIDVKRELLPDYAAYVNGALAGGRGAQDDVLMTVMIWRIDAGDYAGALDIARYALRHSLTLPDQYERSTAAAIAEEFADAALAALRDGSPFDATQLAEVHALTQSCDMHDPISAKLHKALGLLDMRAIGRDSLDDASDRARAQAALASLREALRLDARSGVKQTIARLDSMLSAAHGSAARS